MYVIILNFGVMRMSVLFYLPVYLVQPGKQHTQRDTEKPQYEDRKEQTFS
jgi:hypothetical protein